MMAIIVIMGGTWFYYMLKLPYWDIAIKVYTIPNDNIILEQ